MRTVCVVTGTRAEYGLLRPIMRAVEATRGLRLQTVVTGMHLARRFGYTVREVAADGFRIDGRVPTVPRDDTNAAMAASVGTGVRGFARIFADLRPDVVLVLGDRVEAFAAATAAALSNIIVAHVHGGDRAQAGYDDYMRHAITKMAHLHFAATRASARRIERLGERRDRIWTVGAPGLDEIRTVALPPMSELWRKYFRGMSDPSDLRPPTSDLHVRSAIRSPQSALFLLVVQHPVSTQASRSAREMRETLAAIRTVGLPALVIYPNADPGGRAMISAIEKNGDSPHSSCPQVGKVVQDSAYMSKTNRDSPCFAVASVPRVEYLGLLRGAVALVGNSSSGIIEAPSFRTPVVNIGTRQAGRERAANVIDVPPRRAEIVRGIEMALRDPAFRRRLARCRNPYGDGHAGERIARILARVPLDDRLRMKTITY